MSLRGDYAKLARLQTKLKDLAADDTRAQLSNVVGAAALSRVQLGFRASESPYGEAWAPLKIRAGGKPLLDTGRMRSSISYRPSSNGFEIGTNFVGAAVHQFGAEIVPKRGKFLRFRGKIHGRTRRTTGWLFARKVTIPARPFMPNASRGIPPTWLREMDGAGSRFVSRIMKG